PPPAFPATPAPAQAAFQVTPLPAQAAFPATPAPVQAGVPSPFPSTPVPSPFPSTPVPSPFPSTPVGSGFPDPASGLPGAGAAPVFGPVDVNTATAAQLAGFGEFDLARAERIVAERTARGGFGSIEEFAVVAQLAPHQFARLRHQVRCGPRPDNPSAGRVLDV
ncbi:ComEA family DNA-binding protein, partial [Dactylosporangium fulvum]|uniref:ComEA family DNA-binding protein n=1 Tax=Dactylosporangium fulvum TaxID=53359 RepID=UPI0031D437D0